jgi:hypothetical protein
VCSTAAPNTRLGFGFNGVLHRFLSPVNDGLILVVRWYWVLILVPGRRLCGCGGGPKSHR